MVGKLVVTGQEMPAVAKVCGRTCTKKHISADPVSIRLPYAIITSGAAEVEKVRDERHARGPRNNGSHILFDLQAVPGHEAEGAVLVPARITSEIPWRRQ